MLSSLYYTHIFKFQTADILLCLPVLSLVFKLYLEVPVMHSMFLGKQQCILWWSLTTNFDGNFDIKVHLTIFCLKFLCKSYLYEHETWLSHWQVNNADTLKINSGYYIMHHLNYMTKWNVSCNVLHNCMWSTTTFTCPFLPW